ncbi:hypothetical protein CONLIGDRAFT_143282 [Coniochaeta ligniaria NRRL 30616]|uniref:Uncharacterized protein n=1 Tax=Coniochaeta ligniaria NRRL 30616 TaxID=1408157 RepID=A0A1J7J6M9_9PEZI|nr:hypothetical protein CONLIGDRAFT_143282 [Coniochaeta ligniaria NRRL 30616]
MSTARPNKIQEEPDPDSAMSTRRWLLPCRRVSRPAPVGACEGGEARLGSSPRSDHTRPSLWSTGMLDVGETDSIVSFSSRRCKYGATSRLLEVKTWPEPRPATTESTQPSHKPEAPRILDVFHARNAF